MPGTLAMTASYGGVALWRLLLILCASCLTATAARAAAASPPDNCGTIVLPPGVGISSPADITSFNPLFSTTAYNAYAAAMLYPGLIWVNRFGEIDWSRSLAQSVTTKDNTTFTVTLRPWHWSDGTPVSAADVAYFYKLIAQYGAAWPGYGTGGMPGIVKSIAIVSPTVFNVTAQHPVNPMWFVYNSLGVIQPLPAHAWGRYTLDQLFQAQSTPSFFNVVDGPLKIQSLTVGQDAVFIPNPAWQGRKPHFKRLVYKFLEGDGAALQAVESGDLDAAQLAPNLWDAVAHFPGTHIEVLQANNGADVLNLNYRNPKVAFFKDVHVRVAMAEAIDQGAMIRLLQHGNGNEAHEAVPPSLPKFLPPAMRGGNVPLHYDPDGARAMLLADGYTPGKDGVMQKHGVRLAFTDLLSSGSGRIEEMDEMLQQNFRKIGIEMKVREMDFNQMLSLMGNAPLKWDEAGTGSPILSYPTGEGAYATGAFQNLGGYSDPKMDGLIEDSIDKPGMQGLYDYEAYLLQQQPVIFFMNVKPAVLVSDRLHGFAAFVSPNQNYAPDALYCTPPGHGAGT